MRDVQRTSAYGCGNLSLFVHLCGSCRGLDLFRPARPCAWARCDVMWCESEYFSFIFRVRQHKFSVCVVCVCAVLLYGLRHDQTLDFNSLAMNKHWFLCRVPVVRSRSRPNIQAISENDDVGSNGATASDAGNDHNSCRWWPMANESEQLLLRLRLSGITHVSHAPRERARATHGVDRFGRIAMEPEGERLREKDGGRERERDGRENGTITSTDERIPIGKSESKRKPFNFDRQSFFSLSFLFD